MSSMHSHKLPVRFLRHSLPAIVVLLNIPQVIVSYVLYADEVGLLLGYVVFLFLISYYISFSISRRIFSQYTIDPGNKFLSPIFIILCFLLVSGFLAFTSSEIALFSSIQGASGDLLLDARTAFTKGRTGVELIFVYIYAMLLKGALPISVIYVFSVKHKFRWVLLFLVLFSLLLSLEKFLTAMLVIPVAIYFYFRNERLKFYSFLIIGFIFLVVASFFSKASDLNQASINDRFYRGGGAYFLVHCKAISDGYIGNYNPTCDDIYGARVKVSLSDQDGYRFLLGASGFSYFINRSLWIPFVTSYDSLKYWGETFDGKYLLGATSLPLAFLFDLRYVNIEQAVFNSQFGGEDDTHGRSNTFFAVDSYINFGFFGVLCSSAFCGVLFGWISRCSQPVVSAAAVVTSFSLANNSLIPMIWSGGILVFVFLIILWRVGFSKRK